MLQEYVSACFWVSQCCHWSTVVVAVVGFLLFSLFWLAKIGKLLIESINFSCHFSCNFISVFIPILSFRLLPLNRLSGFFSVFFSFLLYFVSGSVYLQFMPRWCCCWFRSFNVVSCGFSGSERMHVLHFISWKGFREYIFVFLICFPNSFLARICLWNVKTC